MHLYSARALLEKINQTLMNLLSERACIRREVWLITALAEERHAERKYSDGGNIPCVLHLHHSSPADTLIVVHRTVNNDTRNDVVCGF